MIKHTVFSLLFGLWTLFNLTLAHERFGVKLQWNYINYTWPSEEVYLRAAKDESYIEKSNVIAGIKLWNDKMYLTIPRWRNGVPATLAYTAIPTNDTATTAPLLEPFPSWDMQHVGDCAALQSVQNVEIDPKGRMWVIDTGRVATITNEAKATCPPKLLIFDLESGNSLLRSYNFPPEVANPESVYLNDIVLDHEDGGMAYISDSDEKNPGIIVFSLQNMTSWRVEHDSMRAKSDAIGFIVEQTRVQGSFNIGGIALSPAYTEGNRRLYYTALSSFSIFALPTSLLKQSEESMRANVSQEVAYLGRKPSQTDGMVMSNKGTLYFGLLADDAVSKWDSSSPSFTTGQRIIARDHHLMQWPDSFAFDNHGQLWCITNRLQRFLESSLSLDEPNFRAIMADTQMMNYQYYENGTAPELPMVPAGAGRGQLALATLLAVLLAVLMQ